MARAKSALTTTASARCVPFGGANADRASAGEEDFFDRFVQADFHAEALRDARHGGGDRGAAADGMQDAVFVFEEAKESRTGSDSGMATCRDISTGSKTPGARGHR